MASSEHDPDAVVYQEDHIFSMRTRRYSMRELFTGDSAPTKGDIDGAKPSRNSWQTAIFWCIDHLPVAEGQERIRGPYLMDCALFGNDFVLVLGPKHKHASKTFANCEQRKGSNETVSEAELIAGQESRGPENDYGISTSMCVSEGG